MSAFVISENTMQQVVTGIMSVVDDDYPCGFADNRGRQLFELNISAVQQRYPDTIENPQNMPGPIPTPVPEAFRWDGPRFLDTLAKKCQALKAMRCLRYQCSEGDVPETALYGDLEKYIDLLCLEIVDSLPEYKAATWDD